MTIVCAGPISRAIATAPATLISRGAADADALVLEQVVDVGERRVVVDEVREVALRAPGDATGGPSDAGSNGQYGTRVHLSIDGVTRGYFTVTHRYREGMEGLVAQLRRRFRTVLLSGDSGGERAALSKHFGGALEMHFEQSPYEKRDFIHAMQSSGDRVMMVGDGLNDAGALQTADVGISVAEDIAAFAPASDAIIEGTSLRRLDTMLRLSRAALRIIGLAIAISIAYNVVGLTFAVRGDLSPILAAILMPLSSVTAVAVSTITVRVVAHRQGML